MSESANAVQSQSTALTVTAQDMPKLQHEQPKHRISAKVRHAIDAMVWQGLNRDQAAQAAGLKDNSLYVAFRKPEVKSYYLQQCEVLRTSERSRNIKRLVEIRDAADNMPAVQAIKLLEQVSDEPAAATSGASKPGLVIVVQQQTPQVIDVVGRRHSVEERHDHPVIDGGVGAGGKNGDFGSSS